MNTEAQRARNARKRKKLRLKRAAERAANPSLRKQPPAKVGSSRRERMGVYEFTIPLDMRFTRAQQQTLARISYDDIEEMQFHGKEIFVPVRGREMDAYLKVSELPRGGYKSDVSRGKPTGELYVPLTGQTLTVNLRIRDGYHS